MKIILCVDKKNGMMLFGKRQSQDKVQREHMLSLVGNNRLWVSNYSSSLFDLADNIKIDDNFHEKALDNDYCFFEDKEIDILKVNTVVLYKWNRQYPADKYFLYDLKKFGFKLVGKTDFEGSSHERITEEIYKRKD